ncbi:E3 ubiquitin-protein ligase RMA1H1-like [Cicer arietinum]|uniref:E3 ubiquitin-protein ligase RMA n=1 Tax=Cicer arietinum TaxID=3827 RepID=A0A1S2YIN0_CICAR|nr:E3 ubiquitin-protein ligase RMA1H1-like [Cicer arietinum]XP_012572523.1 E3 ubiquitin-protein ligase RMA1H1-like [Cicer arietinum]
MAFEHEHYFSQEWKSIPNSVSENCDSCFDCNICLDFAHEPIVTLCGHLYCWSCIYKWLFVQSASLGPDEPPQCPVCKDDISHTTMVPLYGRGQTANHRDCNRDTKATLRDISVPPRPPASGIQSLLAKLTSPQSVQQLPYRNPYQNQHINTPPYQENDTSQMLNVGAFMTPVLPHLLFGNSENLHHDMMESNSPRWRRQEMQANKSLNRISYFLFCCFFLCFILF